MLGLLYAISQQHKNAVALQIEDEEGMRSFSFDELRECSVDVSASLIKMGIKKDNRIAILSENRPEWVITFFGIISAGGITVPMDIKLTEAEILFVLRDSGARCIFVSGRFLPIITKLKNELLSLGYIVSFDESQERHKEVIYLKDLKCQAGDQRNRPDEIKAEDTALIVYTSGTTGVAKGVELTYGNLLFEVIALHRITPFSRKNRFISILPLNHMLEITGGLIGPLYGGASITYAKSLKPTGLLTLMGKIKATNMICVPLVLKMFHGQIMRELDKQNPIKQKIFKTLLHISQFLLKFNIRIGRFLFYPVHKKFGGHIETFVCGGAPLDSSVEIDFNAMGFYVLQGYGLTETSPVISLNTAKRKKYGSVGKPLEGLDVKILRSSETGGKEGEIIVRGPNVMKGYYRHSEKTGEVIRNGWFHTGDIGWIDEDDFLYISGRMKNLIVLGVGKKVFPEELEEVMSNSPYIKEICVLGKVVTTGSRKGCEEVYAVVVPNLEYFDESKRKSEAAIKEKISLEIDRLSKNLADYKRIKDFEIYNGDLPKTSTRKIKRKVLLEFIQKKDEETGRAKQDQFVEQIQIREDEFTLKLKNILADLLKIPESNIRTHSNLYNDLGVDSLMKVELLCLVEKEFGLTIPDELAYEINTFNDFVRIISEYKNGRVDDVSISEEDIESILKRNVFVRTIRLISTCLFRLFAKIYFRLEVRDIENIPSKKSFIIASNHTSMLDFPILFSCLPLSETQDVIAPAAQDYFYTSFLKRHLVEMSFNTFAFERFGNFVKGLKICSEIIKKKKSIILFPEGARSVEGKLMPFKPGIGSLALELDVALIPTYIYGAYAALPKGSIFPRPRKIIVTFAEPIYAHEFQRKKTGYEVYKDIVKEVEGRVRDLKIRIDKEDR